jgi:hypothetical protein
MQIKAANQEKPRMFLVKHDAKLNIPEKFIKESVEVLKDYFDENWLNQSENHPLQLLWKRNDPLAINEIYTLGNSIKAVENIDEQWVRKKVDNYKKKIEMGAVFEIIAAAALEKRENQKIILPPQKNPGCDLTIDYIDGSKINVSCKQHKKSHHYKLFEEKSENIKNKFIFIGKALGELLGVTQLFATIYSYYHPIPKDWEILEDNFPTILLYAYDNGISTNTHTFKLGNWVIIISDFSKFQMELSDSFFSYNIVIDAPFHKNEIQNFFSHLSDGCHNLEKHGVLQDENNINIIFVSIGYNYSIDECALWARKYLDDNINKPIAGIYFIKPILNRDLETRKNGIIYSTKFIKNKNFDYWNSEGTKNIRIELPVAQGFIDGDGKLVHLYENNGEFSSEPAKNQKVYFFQEGKHFLECTKNKQNYGSFGPKNRKCCVKRTDKGIEIHYLNTNLDHEFLIL